MPQKRVGNLFEDKVMKSVFGGVAPLNGKLFAYDKELVKRGEPQKYYENDNGTLYIGDSLKFLSEVESESVDLVFADPPYNIDKAEWDNFESEEVYIKWSLNWIELASKVLKKTGTLYVMGFSEVLADLRRPASKFFPGGSRWLIWHYKNKGNLGSKNWGRSHESIVQFKKSATSTFNLDLVRIPYSNHTLKYPEHTQAESSQFSNRKVQIDPWRPNPLGAKPRDVFDIPVTSNGMLEKTPHPTQKPEELIRKFILASSNEGEVVLDPFSGSGTTLVCAEQLKRKWLGCDNNELYNKWAVARLETINRRDITNWIIKDETIAARRESIR